MEYHGPRLRAAVPWPVAFSLGNGCRNFGLPAYTLGKEAEMQHPDRHRDHDPMHAPAFPAKLNVTFVRT